jgi:hypothetical protein
MARLGRLADLVVVDLIGLRWGSDDVSLLQVAAMSVPQESINNTPAGVHWLSCTWWPVCTEPWKLSSPTDGSPQGAESFLNLRLPHASSPP